MSLSPIFLLAALLPSAASAQPAGGVKNVQRLNRAPVNAEVLRVSLPRPQEFKLPNGLTVLILEQHKLPRDAADQTMGALRRRGWSGVELLDKRELLGLFPATVQARVVESRITISAVAVR